MPLLLDKTFLKECSYRILPRYDKRMPVLRTEEEPISLMDQSTSHKAYHTHTDVRTHGHTHTHTQAGP